MTSEAKGTNADQVAYWNEVAGPRWVQFQAMLDEQLDPVGKLGMDASAVRPGEAVLDVGCGCGSTTLELARRAGNDGRATGIDISRPMLDVARGRAHEHGFANARFELADAQTYVFRREYDLLFSRFGVMFFDDPTGAFTNLRAALKPTGRLAFVCWQAMHRNPWMTVPLMAAMKHVTIEPPASLTAPGPFAFADADRVVGILHDAGFKGAKARGEDIEMSIGGAVGLEGAVRFVLELGPLARALGDVTAELKSAVASEVRESLAPHEKNGVVRLAGAIWIVTADA